MKTPKKPSEAWPTKADIARILKQAADEVATWPEWLKSSDVEEQIRALRGVR